MDRRQGRRSLHRERRGRRGVATGSASGNAINLRYVLAVPIDGTTRHLDMDDWMYLVDERTLLNRTTMSKWDLRLGDITIAFRKG